MTFTPEQIKMLDAPLDPKNVKPAPKGKYGEYIEGWHVIAEANRIFGYDGWGSQTDLTQLGEPIEIDGKWRVNYRAVCTLTVAGVTRQGCGFGQGIDRDIGQAHESALKEAETDARKRAFMTFGNPFGLALYDKSKANVSTPPPELMSDAQRDEITAMAQGAGVTLQGILNAFNKNNPDIKAQSLKDLPSNEFEPIKKVLQDRMEKNAAKPETTT